MKTIISLALFSFTIAFPCTASAQIINNWNKVDTVTAGDFDDLNPSIVHDVFLSYPSGYLRMVFERHTASESQIAARKFNRSSATWDSSDVVISSRPSGEEQKYPDYSEVSYHDSSLNTHVIRVAAWQVRKDNRWQICFSTLNDGAPAWSAPAILVNDSLDNTCVQVRPFLDSAVIISWKRSNTIMGISKTMSTTAPAETLAVSSSDSVEYDMSSKFGTTNLVWTSNVGGIMTPLYRLLNRYSQIQFSAPETLAVPNSCYHPHLTVSQMADPTFFFETRNSGVSDIFCFLYGRYTPGSISGDPLSDNRNARSFNFPYITKPAAGAWNPTLSLFGLVVYERNRPADSSIVFIYGSMGDTVRAPGHNWHALVSSQPFVSQTGENVLVVWESNRSGRGHIYSRVVPIFFDAIVAGPPQPVAFELLQNFPNPFNPSTTIRYVLPGKSHVILSVFNTLGQQVATLVSETQDAGYHDVRFDAGGLASGVYFYRLSTGYYAETKKLILTK